MLPDKLPDVSRDKRPDVSPGTQIPGIPIPDKQFPDAYPPDSRSPALPGPAFADSHSQGHGWEPTDTPAAERRKRAAVLDCPAFSAGTAGPVPDGLAASPAKRAAERNSAGRAQSIAEPARSATARLNAGSTTPTRRPG
jgi:hypothetical protein